MMQSESSSFRNLFPRKETNGAPPVKDFKDFPRILHPLVTRQTGGTQLEFGVEEVLPGSEIPWHKHEDAEEVLFFFKGRGTGYIGEETCELEEGSTMFIPKDTLHRVVNGSKTESLWLTYSFAPPGIGGSQYKHLEHEKGRNTMDTMDMNKKLDPSL